MRRKNRGTTHIRRLAAQLCGAVTPFGFNAALRMNLQESNPLRHIYSEAIFYGATPYMLAPPAYSLKIFAPKVLRHRISNYSLSYFFAFVNCFFKNQNNRTAFLQEGALSVLKTPLLRPFSTKFKIVIKILLLHLYKFDFLWYTIVGQRFPPLCNYQRKARACK